MKRMRLLWICFASSLGAFAVPAFAHHSFAAVYKPDETIRIEGKVVQFLFRNPHSVLHVLVTDKRDAGELDVPGVQKRNGWFGKECDRIRVSVVRFGKPNAFS